MSNEERNKREYKRITDRLNILSKQMKKQVASIERDLNDKEFVELVRLRNIYQLRAKVEGWNI